MTIYYSIYSSTDDDRGTSTSGTYSTARTAEPACASLTSTTTTLTHSFSTPNYTCSVVFFVFDTSSVPSGAGSGALYWNGASTGNADSDTVELRQASSAATKISGATVSSLSLLGSSAWAAISGYNAYSVDPSVLSRSATSIVVAHTEKYRLGTPPTGANSISVSMADSSGTTVDPYLFLTMGTPWTYVGKSSSVASASSGNITLTEPSGVTSGDLLVATIAYRSNAAFTLPSGGEWTLVASQQSSGNTATNTTAIGSGLMAYCVRGGSAPNLVFTRTSGDIALGSIVAYRGNSATPYDTGSANTLGANSATVTTGTFTTAEDDELIVAMYGGGQEGTASAFVASSASPDALATSGTSANVTANPSPNLFQERLESTTTTGADTALAVADAVKTGAGATGTIQMTSSISGARHVMIAGAFKLAAAAGYADLTVTAGAVTLAGTSSTLRAARQVAVTAASVALTGNSVTLKRGSTLTVTAASVALTGQSVTLKVTRQLTVTAGAVTLTGQSVALKRAFPLTVTAGSVTLTGNSTTLTVARKIAVTAGSVALAGQSVTLKATRQVSVTAGSVTLTGQSATISVGRKVNVTAGSVVLTGNSADLTYTPSGTTHADLTVTAGAIALTGQSVTLKVSRQIAVTAGAVALTGNSATLKATRQVTVTAGSVSLTGNSSTLKAARQVAVTAASIALTGQATSLARGLKVNVTAGSVTLTGQSVTLKVARQVAVTAAAVTLTGQSVTLKVTRQIAVTAGSISLTGQATTLKAARQVSVTAAAITLASQSVALDYSGAAKTITVTDGSITLTGNSATLTVARKISVTAGTVALAGGSADITYTPVVNTDIAFWGGAFYQGAFHSTPNTVTPAVDNTVSGGGGGGYELRKSDHAERIAKRRRELRKLDDLIRRARDPEVVSPAIAPKIAAVVAEINRSADTASIAQIIAGQQQLRALLGQVETIKRQIAADQEQDEEDVLMLLLEAM